MLISVRSRSTIKTQTERWMSHLDEYRDMLNDIAIISINGLTYDPGEKTLEKDPLPFSNEFIDIVDVLPLWFHDVYDISSLPEKEQKKYVLFDETMAKQIHEFADKANEKGKNIIVHCLAGISRSGAVGRTLNDYFNRYLENKPYDLNWFFHTGCERMIDPNPLVVRILKKELGL